MASSTPYHSKFLDNGFVRFCPLSVVEIQADADEIWREIERFDQWETWNPLYVESRGSFAEGNTVRFAVALPGMSPQSGKATVTKVQPNEFVRYEINSMGGLVKAVRFIEIRQLEPGRCQVANGEIMGGILGPVLFRFMGERVRQGLEGMNRALKSRVERDFSNAGMGEQDRLFLGE